MGDDTNIGAELLPCPFCGGEAELACSASYYVECIECGAEGPWYEDGKEEAITAWNTRTRELVPAALLREAVEALEYVRPFLAENYFPGTGPAMLEKIAATLTRIKGAAAGGEA